MMPRIFFLLLNSFRQKNIAGSIEEIILAKVWQLFNQSDEYMKLIMTFSQTLCLFENFHFKAFFQKHKFKSHILIGILVLPAVSNL